MTLTANIPTIDTLEGLAYETGIPIEWLNHNNVSRNDTKKAWLFKGRGEQPQYRYDVPRIDPKTGKERRYESKTGTKADISVPCTTEGKPITVDALPFAYLPIVITEGMKKALKACSVGIDTVSVSGVYNGLRKGDNGIRRICPTLQLMIDSGFKTYTIAFDADAHTNPDVCRATIELAKALIAEGCTVKIATGLWTIEQGKGMDDFITQNGADAMRAVLEKALSLDVWVEKFAPITKPKSKSKKDGHAAIVAILSDFYGDRIRLNEMSNQVEKDGKDYYIDNCFIHISYDTGLELSKGYAIDYLIEVAKNNAYHPVINYLESVKEKSSTLDADNTASLIADMLSQATGVTDKLHLTFLVKTLVAAVARVINPGCFFKNVCVLHGKQNAGKSSFWRELVGYKFFSDSYKGTSDQKDLMVLHEAWISEISEFDKVYRKTDVANLKGVISSPFDKLVLPYGRSVRTLHRRSIMVATSNSQEILRDPTGSSRFWVVSIPGKIDFKTLLENRDFIWSCAYRLHELGYSYELSDDEQVASESNNETYSGFDPVFDAVKEACQKSSWNEELKEYVVLAQIYGLLNPESDGKLPSKPSEWRPIADALTRLGYTSGHKPRLNGKTVSAWKLEKVVTTVTNAESHSVQVSPSVTLQSGTVTEVLAHDTKLSPLNEPRCQDGDSTVTPAAQGSELLVTSVTPQVNYQEIIPRSDECQVGDIVTLTENHGGRLVQHGVNKQTIK